MIKSDKEYMKIKEKILQSDQFSVYDITTKFVNKNQETEFYRIYRKVERVVRDLSNEERIKFFKIEKSKSPSEIKRIYKVKIKK